jgi:hypothetical protein
VTKPKRKGLAGNRGAFFYSAPSFLLPGSKYHFDPPAFDPPQKLDLQSRISFYSCSAVMTDPPPSAPAAPPAPPAAPSSDAPAPLRIPVLCDRCRAEGFGGDEGFADLGDLLEFAPVPRKVTRSDGWTPDVQRAFIAALAVTGSDRQAARAVGKAQFGVEQLKKAPGNEGFLHARARALAMAAGDKARRLAAGLHAVTEPAALWRKPEPAWGEAASRRHALDAARAEKEAEAAAAAREAAAAQQDAGDAEDMAVLEKIVLNYLRKLESERAARLEGRIAEADFYLRQVTVLEVALDLASEDGMARLKALRRGGHDLLHIAQTPLSAILDEVRRRHWLGAGDPPRPYPPYHLFVEQEGVTLEPLEVFHAGELTRPNPRRAFEERYAADAKEHVEWEAQARRDYEERRASDATS